MSSEDEDLQDFGGMGSPLTPPRFDSEDTEDDAFSIDLPTDDLQEAPHPEGGFDEEAAFAARGEASASQLNAPAKKRGAVMGLPIDIVVAVGRARPLLTELVALRRDSVLTLDSRIDDPVELIVGERVIARGELQEIEPGTGKLGVRLTEVADPRENL